ncbi:MAG: ABC transporter ATP-binding protein [Phycisphaeraceae bacterium]|nr:ABC transporter ATP-binding protein [Phycisphaerales bacterium]MCB9843522.1 ABC transporter ATP-binding protein [Phycisphaeraceae bacterium]
MMLRCDKVCFSYSEGRTVLRDVSIAADRGVTVILGPNGAGKSTLLRVMAGLLTPESGRVSLGSESVEDMNAAERARRVAYISQTPVVSASISVRQVVSLGRVVIGRDGPAVERALVRTGLRDMADRAFHELSAGQKQRVMLARALAQLEGRADGTRVLIADEPITALDPSHAARASMILREAGRETAVVIVVHDPTLALAVADRAVILSSDGRVLSQGTGIEVITPETLSEAFGVEFDRAEIAVEGEGRPSVALIPRMTGSGRRAYDGGDVPE